MAAIIDGGITGDVGRATEGSSRGEGPRRGIDSHALGSAAATTLVPIVGLHDIRTNGHALVLGASGDGLGLSVQGRNKKSGRQEEHRGQTMSPQNIFQQTLRWHRAPFSIVILPKTGLSRSSRFMRFIQVVVT